MNRCWIGTAETILTDSVAVFIVFSTHAGMGL
jgi:hypothetical protein